MILCSIIGRNESYLNLICFPSSPKMLSVHPPTLQADVSFLSHPSDAYYLTVTAVIGQNESDPAPPDGITFSYFMNSPAHQKCE